MTLPHIRAEIEARRLAKIKKSFAQNYYIK